MVNHAPVRVFPPVSVKVTPGQMEQAMNSAAALGDKAPVSEDELVDYDGCCDEKPGEESDYKFRDEAALLHHVVDPGWLLH